MQLIRIYGILTRGSTLNGMVVRHVLVPDTWDKLKIQAMDSSKKYTRILPTFVHCHVKIHLITNLLRENSLANETDKGGESRPCFQPSSHLLVNYF